MEFIVDVLKVLTPIVVAFISGWFVHQAKGKKALKVKLLRAYKDIRFLQEIEKVHNEFNVGRGETDKKKLTRNIVRRELGLDYSGNTPSMVDAKIQRIELELH